VRTLSAAYVDYDHKFLFVNGLKNIIRFQKGNPIWDLEKLYAQRQKKNWAIESAIGSLEL